jgi:hypothetical protein
VSYPKAHANARNDVRSTYQPRGSPLARLVLSMADPFPSTQPVIIAAEVWRRMLELARAEVAE